jgi:hypothetical protein
LISKGLNFKIIALKEIILGSLCYRLGRKSNTRYAHHTNVESTEIELFIFPSRRKNDKGKAYLQKNEFADMPDNPAGFGPDSSVE